jgi:hypothetical protein
MARNAYGFDFDVNGVPYTSTSDNERCVGCRGTSRAGCARVPGRHQYGWLNCITPPPAPPAVPPRRHLCYRRQPRRPGTGWSPAGTRGSRRQGGVLADLDVWYRLVHATERERSRKRRSS